jgi:hypothetical protein
MSGKMAIAFFYNAKFGDKQLKMLLSRYPQNPKTPNK